MVICGGGSSAHTLIPLLRDSCFEVSIFTSRPAEWNETIELQYQSPEGKVYETFSGPLKRASDNAADIIPEADYIVFCMPVHKYRIGLQEIAPYINRKKTVFLGTMYGQGGWNWMVDEIKRQFSYDNIVTFAFGLIPWIARIIEYGKIGVTYGCKAVNYATCYPKSYFKQIDEEFFEEICYRWFHKGAVQQSDNFISLTLSVDNQIIHTSRCYGLYKVYGRCWKNKADVPMFYKDYDDVSADLLSALDKDYSKIRNEIRHRYPLNDYRYMLDYLALERFSYNSNNTGVKESFVNSQTLVAIGTPVVENADGLWEIDNNHRFFMDDIYYGNCIAKWIAEQMNLEVPTIDAILRWAQMVRNERIIDEDGNLIVGGEDLGAPFKSGLPCYYGFKNIDDIID